MPDQQMPPDPFPGEPADFGGIAAAVRGFYVAFTEAGFAEPHALELAARYLAFLLGLCAAGHPAVQQQPGQPQGG